MRTMTDSNGFFRLAPVPPGRFFVHVDGRTAVGSQWPGGAYYPFVGKAWESEPGKDLPAGGTGQIFLPLVMAGTLQPVSMVNTTMITCPPEIVAANPAFAGVMLMVPPNNLFADDGTRGGMVGIAPVPPDRIPEPLPAGLEFPIVITVQTDGPQNFDKPVPVCFPNLPDPSTHQPLPPGTRNWLYSFDHDIGRFIPIGPMTVSADGSTICTDPGVGILEPGWHGSGPPPEEPEPDDCVDYATNIRPGEDCFSRADCIRKVRARYVACERCKLLGQDGGRDINNNLCNLEFDLCYYDCHKNFSKYFKDDFLTECLRSPLRCYINLCRAKCLDRASDCRDFQFCNERAFGGGGRGLAPASARQLQQIGQLYDQVVSLLYPFIASAAPEVPENVQNEIMSLLAQATAVAGTNVDVFLEQFLLQHEATVAMAQMINGTPRTLTPPHPVFYAAQILRPSGLLTLRGMTGPNGQYSLFVPRDGTLLSVSFYDPIVNGHDVVFPYTRPNLRYRIPRFSLHPIEDTELDFDQDGLPDGVEFALGTDTSRADSDGDGISDKAEIEQGTNPIDGTPAITGIIASTPTPGPAFDIAAFNNLALVAELHRGVSVFGVESGEAPTLLAQVDTPGNATAVAFSAELAAVADGSAGLAVIDLSDPGTAFIRHQVNLGSPPVGVATAGPFAYAGLFSGEVVVVDMVSGSVLGRLMTETPMHDVTLERESLLVLTGSKLFTISLEDGDFQLAGSVNAPGLAGAGGHRFRLFAGAGLAYGTDTFGYRTFNVSNAILPSIIVDANTTQAGWRQLVANGSGLGIAAVGNNSTDDGPHDINVYDLSQPTNNNLYLTTFVTPGLASAVSAFNALAYVADSDAGLQVINYREYDRFGVAPTIGLSTSTASNLASAGKLLRVSAAVTDDVQVRNVEFHVDGVLVVTDGNFPFEHRFITPLLTETKTNIVIRAKATDTGGNSTWSDTLVLTLVPDATPPRPTLFTPPNLSFNLEGSVDTVAAFFNEPLDPATVNAGGVLLFIAGPDGITGNGDDVPVTNGTLSYRADVNGVVLSFAQPPAAGLYRGVLRPPLAGTTGLVISERSWTFTIRAPVRWIVDADGFWDVPANWSGGVVPQANDFVIINRPSGNYTVTYRSGNVSLSSLRSDEALVVSGGTLTLLQQSSVNNDLDVHWRRHRGQRRPRGEGRAALAGRRYAWRGSHAGQWRHGAERRERQGN